MLDPFTALSLAAAVVQFVDFGSKILSDSYEIYRAGAPPEHEAIKSIATDLATLVDRIQHDLELASRLDGPLDANDQALQLLARRASELASQLLQTLQPLKASSKSRRWGSLCQALKTVWGKDKIENLMRQLQYFRSEMELRILVDLRKDVAVQNLRNDARFDTMSDDVRAIAITVLDEHAQIFGRLDTLTQTVQKGQNETNMLIKESEDKIVNAIRELKISTGPYDLTRSGATCSLISTESASEVEDIILDNLSFGRMEVREEIISPAHQDTFKWILNDTPVEGNPWPSLIRWLRDDGDCYWINGKAASGKSTLMKFLTRQPQVHTALKVWAGSSELLVVPFFFWNLGSDLQKSQEGLLRSILHSILSKYRTLTAKVMPGYFNDIARKARRKTDSEQLPHVEPLTLIELEMAFLKLFEILPESIRLCLFIDGIDEFSGDHTRLAELLKTTASRKAKIVLSSRPVGPYIAAFQKYPTLRLQDLTRNDIVSYVRAQFETNEDMKLLSETQPKDVDNLVEEILSRSCGVFLWVELVVRSLLRGLTAGDGLEDLRRRLNQYPEELEPLYKHMLHGVDELYRVQASKYLQIVLKGINVQCKVPLSLLQISFAEEADPNSVCTTPWRKISNREVTSRCKAVERRIISRCCGLIELEKADFALFGRGNSVVNLIHMSVKEFLERSDTWASMTSLTASIGYDTHWALGSSCLSLLKSFSLVDEISKLNLIRLGYIIEYLVRYCREAEKSSNRANVAFFCDFSTWVSKNWAWFLSQRVRFQALLVPTFERHFRLLKNQVPSCLTLAVVCSLHLHLQEELDSRPPSYHREEGALLLLTAASPRTLSCATANSYLPALEETIKRLLKNGENPNSATNGQLSPWMCALSSVCALSHWILSQDPEGFTRWFPTISRESWSLIWLRICEMYLSNGAHANAVVYRPKLRVSYSPHYWFVEDEPEEAFSALAVIQDLFRVQFEVVPRSHFQSSANMEEEMRRMERRLVGLLVERGAESRRWVGGKQVSGPLEHTPLATLIEHSSTLVNKLKDS